MANAAGALHSTWIIHNTSKGKQHTVDSFGLRVALFWRRKKMTNNLTFLLGAVLCTSIRAQTPRSQSDTVRMALAIAALNDAPTASITQARSEWPVNSSTPHGKAS